MQINSTKTLIILNAIIIISFFSSHLGKNNLVAYIYKIDIN